MNDIAHDLRNARPIKTHHFTFREAMEFIKRDERRQFWMGEAAQVSVVILLALALGFVLGME